MIDRKRIGCSKVTPMAMLAIVLAVRIFVLIAVSLVDAFEDCLSLMIGLAVRAHWPDRGLRPSVVN